MKICRIATVPFMLYHHLRVQIADTCAAGHHVTLVCSNGPEVQALRQIPGVSIVLIDIPRAISVGRDLIALWGLIRYFRKEKFDVVHSITPKAGLLSMLAAWLVRVPVRMHTFTGQPWVELTGVKRQIVKVADKFSARFSTINYTDSHSQMEFLIDEGVVARSKIKTLGSGSLAGIDVRRFNPERFAERRSDIRRELRLNDRSKVVVFVGRMTRDKGIVELVSAFADLQSKGFDYQLLLVGPQEMDRDPLPTDTLYIMQTNASIRCVGYSNEPEKYLAVSDVLCLPSYREGFGSVILEAAAMGLPSIGTDIVGVRDAIVSGKTGLLVPPKNVEALQKALAYLLEGHAVRCKLGQQARIRALRDFDASAVNLRVISEYGSSATFFC